MSRNFPVWLGEMVVAIVIVISSVFGGFDRVGKVLAALTVRLQVSNYSQLSDYKSTEKFVKYKAPCASIAFEEIVIVMIN